MKIFFYKFFICENFFYLIFFGENFSFYKNISFVFDVCEIMYFAKFFIRNFAYCDFFVLQFSFSAMNVNTKFENVSFLKKNTIFSDRTFEFFYSLLVK